MFILWLDDDPVISTVIKLTLCQKVSLSWWKFWDKLDSTSWQSLHRDELPVIHLLRDLQSVTYIDTNLQTVLLEVMFITLLSHVQHLIKRFPVSTTTVSCLVRRVLYGDQRTRKKCWRERRNETRRRKVEAIPIVWVNTEQLVARGSGHSVVVLFSSWAQPCTSQWRRRSVAFLIVRILRHS